MTMVVFYTIATSGKHTDDIERFIIPKNADPTRTHLNRKLITYPDGIKDRSAAIQRRLEEARLTRKIGNNQVRAIRINVSGIDEDMERICTGTRKRRTYTSRSFR